MHDPSNRASGQSPSKKKDIKHDCSQKYPYAVFECLMNPGGKEEPEAVTQLIVVAGGSEAPFLKVEIYTIYPNS
jgi:hypothetical protein